MERYLCRALICVFYLMLVLDASYSRASRNAAADDGSKTGRGKENSACSAMGNRCLCRRIRRKEQKLTCLKQNCMERLPTDEISDKQVKEVVSLLVTRQRNLTRIGSDELRRLGNIRHIRIFRCRINEVAPNAFIGLNDVERLDLHLNDLAEVPTAIRYLANLKSLNLGGNHITIIRNGAFYANRHLERLILGRNSLTKMPSLLPASLVKLSLNQNSLESLDGIMRLTNLIILNADGNKLAEFPRLPSSVNVVSLCSNLINQTISLSGFPRLKVVILNHNPGLGRISLSTFYDVSTRSSASKLENFEARNSGVRSVDVDAFSCVSWLRHVDIADNLITDYHELWFSKNKGLRRILLSGNPFRCTCDVTSSLRQISEVFTKRRELKQRQKVSASSRAVFSFANDFDSVVCSSEELEPCRKFKFRSPACEAEDQLPEVIPAGPASSRSSSHSTSRAATTRKATLSTTMPTLRLTAQQTTTTASATTATTSVTTATTKPSTSVTTTRETEPVTRKWVVLHAETLQESTTQLLPPTTTLSSSESTVLPTTTAEIPTSTIAPLKTTAASTTAESTTTEKVVMPPLRTLPVDTVTTSTNVTTTVTETSTTEIVKEEWCLRDGRKCHFPFLYNGENHTECIRRWNPWCSATYNYHEDEQWDICRIC